MYFPANIVGMSNKVILQGYGVKIDLWVITCEFKSLVSTSILTFKSSLLLKGFIFDSPKSAIKNAEAGVET